ncbi:hypothetical protein AKO1_007576 [Acrasis kona]|uniref:Uncharacterized protein n=1 Tax=Acrasis kona TaxID=1008807 RepID=A0AAW2YQC1_9EUKA
MRGEVFNVIFLLVLGYVSCQIPSSLFTTNTIGTLTTVPYSASGPCCSDSFATETRLSINANSINITRSAGGTANCPVPFINFALVNVTQSGNTYQGTGIVNGGQVGTFCYYMERVGNSINIKSQSRSAAGCPSSTSVAFCSDASLIATGSFLTSTPTPTPSSTSTRTLTSLLPTMAIAVTLLLLIF